ncbi:MAG: glycosyl hydrolase, partial [Eudoraea sp.]|uniref:WD40/YVTN/BNR-like repeat-containing protein n=1 Tax=Eudoraea sp. TaxID=1979955 RepID=UPI003C73268F
RALRQRAWYYSRIYADTQDKNKIYVMNVSYGISTDGGRTFTLKNAPHGDHHDLWIDPNNNQRMVIADDGGAQVSNDGGTNWTTYHNQPTAQFYRVTTDNSFPYRIYGAQQDNSTVRIAHRSPGGSIGEKDWQITAGGESAHLAPDPKNNDIVYGGTYKGYMMRYDHSINQTRSTNVWPDNPAGSGVEIMKYRFNWNYPVMFSIHDKNRLYAGSNFLHISTNEGQSWEVISPDLTRGLPETIKSSGGPITQDNTGAEFYSNIFAIAESPLEKGVIYVGSDDGLVHISKDDGANWTNITPANGLSPKLNMINCIEPSPFTKGVAYLAATSYKFGDYTPYLYKTTNYGESWTLITNGIKENHYTRAIRSDKVREGLLYAGTEWGMYISFDDGQNWSTFQLNLPMTSIRDLAVRDNDLIAATHGRSFWMIDDLTPLHQLSDDLAKNDFILYKPDLTYRTQQSSGWNKANMKLEGENHPNGVIINYYIKEKKDTDTLSLEILDSQGKIIQKYNSYSKEDKLDPSATKPLKAVSGGNRFIWDLSYPGFKSFEGMVLYSSPNRGPKAVPGTYKVRLNYNGNISEKEFTVVKDPRLTNTEEDFINQFDFLIEVRDQVSRANQAIIDIRSVKKDLDYVKEKATSDQDLKNMVAEFESKLDVVENNIHMTKNQSRQDPLNYGIRINNRLAFLMSDSQRGDYPPTDQARAFFVEVKKELDQQITSLNELFSNYVSKINRLASENQIKMISVK